MKGRSLIRILVPLLCGHVKINKEIMLNNTTILKPIHFFVIFLNLFSIYLKFVCFRVFMGYYCMHSLLCTLVN
jgi:hypothetical protein